MGGGGEGRHPALPHPFILQNCVATEGKAMLFISYIYHVQHEI